jgi:hypothetical protein
MTGALCDLRDVISACGALRVPGAVLSTDFSGAFDAVHHDFLYEVLRRRGVSPHFIEVLRAMYTGAGSRLLVNGVLTQSFPVLRSVRQGCPLSMVLFSVVLAPLLQYLERRLQGLSLANACLKVSSYADDAYYILRSAEEATVVHGALEDFGHVSGLVVNIQKCGVLALGTWNPATDVGFPYTETLKVLGVEFKTNIKQATRDNWASVLASVRGVLRDNAARALGLTQRAAYVNIFALSRMWHVAQVLPVPRTTSTAIIKAVRMYLWRGQLFTITTAAACTPRAQGGLGLPDLEKKCLALFTGRWQGILVDDPDSFAGEWLLVLLGAFPLGALQRAVWPSVSYYRTFHSTRTTASSAPPEVPARNAILAIYAELVNQEPPLMPRVVVKSPGVLWQRVWANIHHAAVPVDARDSWWKAVHDLVATRHRLHRIGRSESRMCPVCAVPDTLAHRLCRCTRTRDAWRWTRATLTRLLGTMATPRTLLQPDFAPPSPERHATAAWVAGHHVHLVTTASRTDAATFAANMLRAKSGALARHSCPPTLQRGLNQWVK